MNLLLILSYLPALLLAQELKHTTLDVGLPLGEADRARYSYLPPTNVTYEEMQTFLEIGEAKAINAQAKARNTRNANAMLKYHWPNGEVPYEISASFTADERAIILAAMDDITSQTNQCIKFVAKTSETDYMYIKADESGCFAHERFWKGMGIHLVNLQQNGCVYNKVALHEFLHILSVQHEQQRPDRDDYVTMHWDNIQGAYASNMWKHAWDTEDTAALTKCEETQNVWADYSGCYSGLTVTAYGYPYDFQSVMHYSLSSFAIDGSRNAMTPKDASVTSVGGSVMSEMDLNKLKAAYNCGAPNVCGGYITGDSGSIEDAGTNSCDWLIEVESGYAIELTAESFQAVCPNKLEIRNGNTKESALIKSFCDSEVPSLLISPDSSLYISWSVQAAGQSFKLNWKKVPVTCCDSVKLSSSGLASSQYSSIISNSFTYTANDDVNGRPVYRNGNYWIAHTGSQWVMSSTQFAQPGSSSGFFFGSSTAMCPTGVGAWRVLNQSNSEIENDSTLMATCDVECSATPPAAPAGATMEWNQDKAVNSVVKYVCSATENKYASCGTDGNWSPATIEACSTTTTAEPTTTAEATTTEAATTTAEATTTEAATTTAEATTTDAATTTAGATTEAPTFPTTCLSSRKRKRNTVGWSKCRMFEAPNDWDGIIKYERERKLFWNFKHPNCDLQIVCEGFDTIANAACSKGDRLIIKQGSTVLAKYCGTDGPDGATFPASAKTRVQFATNKKSNSTGFKCYALCAQS